MTDNERQTRVRWRSLLDVVATVFMTIAALVMVLWVARSWVTRPRVVQVEPALPTELLTLDGAELRGNRAAKVAIIEYSDFQCLSCGEFARESLPLIDRRYVRPGRVLLAFRHFPMSGLHVFAFGAAEAATCAGRQGKFWSMHTMLFQNQEHLGREDLLRAAARLGLETGTFGACLRGQATAQVVQEAGTGLRLGVNGTPTLFIGMTEDGRSVKVSRRVSGGIPASELSTILDDLLLGR